MNMQSGRDNVFSSVTMDMKNPAIFLTLPTYTSTVSQKLAWCIASSMFT